MRLVNILKEFIRKNQKVLIISLVVISIFGLLIDLLIYDQRQTTTENQQRTEKQAAVVDNLSPDFRDYVPDWNEGSMIYMFPVVEPTASRQQKKLMTSKEFRQSLYFALNRVAIAEKFNDTKDAKLQSKPTAVLFTKDFWSNNPKFLPEPYFPLTADSKKLYDDIELTKHGYNFERALECLGKAWDQLSEEEKKQDYELGIDFDYSEKLALNNDLSKREITDNIKKLFDTFIQNKLLKPAQLKLKTEVISSGQISYNTNIVYKVDIYLYDTNENREDWHQLYFLTFCFFYDDFKIKFDFRAIKHYLESVKSKDNDVNENPLLKGRSSNPDHSNVSIKDISIEHFWQGMDFAPIQDNGYWEGNTSEFESLQRIGLNSLFQIFRGSQNQISTELKEVKQKTYEEIYEKMFNLMTKECYCIPVVIIQEVKEVS